MVKIKELTSFDERNFAELKTLLAEVSERLVLCRENLQALVDAPDCHLYVLTEDESIVGTATLCVFRSLEGAKAIVEDVAVLQSCRGRHYGRMLMEYLLEEASRMAPIELQLTSAPKRIAANTLYRSLGFNPVTTNCYRLQLE